MENLNPSTLSNSPNSSKLSKHVKRFEPVESVRLSPEHVLKKLILTRCNAWGGKHSNTSNKSKCSNCSGLVKHSNTPNTRIIGMSRKGRNARNGKGVNRSGGYMEETRTQEINKTTHITHVRELKELTRRTHTQHAQQAQDRTGQIREA